MYNENVLKLGIFGSNCSNGRYLTTAPERWPGSWDDNERLATMLDDAGIDFFLPIARWRGYGGETDYQGSSFETITWATALLARTKRITIFGTVHAPLFPPLIAAKQIVTADHAGRGRFALNMVCGWNEDEFDMFGVKPGDHGARYRQGQEWLDVLRLVWDRDEFDFSGEFFEMHHVRGKPKPYGGTHPLIMNAGASGDGRAFALRNCDAWFTHVRPSTDPAAPFGETEAIVRAAKNDARALGREIGVYISAMVVCRPSRREAEEYHRYVTVEHADLGAIDKMLEMKGRVWDQPSPEVARWRAEVGRGMGSLPLIGSPDDIAEILAGVSAAGVNGVALSLVNDVDEFPYLQAEVLPRLERLGLRKRV